MITREAVGRMKFFKQWGAFMVEGSRSFARWEVENAKVIMGSRKRMWLLALLLIPCILGGLAFADEISQALPSSIGGKEAYSPSYYSTFIFLVSIFIGMGAGLISGCIGAGGGFIIAPALMSAGVKGILAVGTDLFHIFAKAIMGSVLHRKMGNVCAPLAFVFLIGAIIGTTVGAGINRMLYNINPILSDAFITTVYTIMLGFLGFYGMYDYFSAKKASKSLGAEDGREGSAMTGIAQKLQSVNLPPMVSFDQGLIPGGRKISWLFLVLSGILVGMAAGIMGVGGGFLTFPIFVYILGVSSLTTVGTDIFQIVFTAGYGAITQYAIYGFIFYTLAMGMLLGSLIGIQIGALVTKVVPGITIRGFFAISVMAGFVNRFFALPKKLVSMEILPASMAGTASLMDTVGMYLFFIVIALFGLWVFGAFFGNIKKLKGEA
jgi:uncharacterized membrane protein YfcA